MLAFHSRLIEAAAVRFFLGLRVVFDCATQGVQNDGLLAPATAWIRKKYEFFIKLLSR
jgi:hypothetical protein